MTKEQRKKLIAYRYNFLFGAALGIIGLSYPSQAEVRQEIARIPGVSRRHEDSIADEETEGVTSQLSFEKVSGDNSEAILSAKERRHLTRDIVRRRVAV